MGFLRFSTLSTEVHLHCLAFWLTSLPSFVYWDNEPILQPSQASVLSGDSLFVNTDHL